MNTIQIQKQGANVKMIAPWGLSGLEREINCWTVDKPEDAARVIVCSVDDITADSLE